MFCRKNELNSKLERKILMQIIMLHEMEEAAAPLGY